MDIKQEISQYSEEVFKEPLLWLFNHYHMEWQWHFVATCKFVPYGTRSYEANRVWTPTPEGLILFFHRNELG